MQPYGTITVTEGNPTNRVLFSLTGVTDKDESGKAIGDDLWDLDTWGSTTEDCSGTKHNPKTQNNLQQSQMDRDVYEGQDVSLGAVDTEFDMSGLNCEEVKYFCAHLKKNAKAEPDFEFETKPDESAAIASFAVDCKGKGNL